MISKDQIRILLGDIENERVERTVSTKDTDKFAKAVCAFANDLSNKKMPGYLMIGVHDDGSLSGLEVSDELLRNLAGLRSDGNIQPKPALMVEKISFPEGDIAVVEVQPSKNTPVRYKGTIYVRIGARKSEANEEEERILREKSELKYFSIDWASEYDGPGIRTVLYLQGCHLDCPWCHTPSSKPQNPPILFLEHLCTHCGQCVKVCPNNCHYFTNGRHKYSYKNCQKCLKCIMACPHSNIDDATGVLVYTVKVKAIDELFNTLYPQLLFLKRAGGITISGGEPLTQYKSVGHLLSLCKNEGVNTAIETSGNLPVSTISELYKNVDYWLIGLHPWTKNGYVFNDNASLFLDFLVRHNANISIRMPLIPDYTDTDEAIQTQCRILNRFGINQIDLMLYNQYTSFYHQALGINMDADIKKNATSDISRITDLFASCKIECNILN